MSKNKKVALIGSVGVPANYGGFETLVDNIIGDNCSEGIDYTVYCSSKAYSKKLKKYKGAKLKYLPFKANGIQAIIYDAISILDALIYADILVILGVTSSFLLPLIKLFSTKKIIVNVDGLSFTRDKFSFFQRLYLKTSFRIAVKSADVIVADNKAIQEFIKDGFGKSAILIEYGGDHALGKNIANEELISREYSIEKGKYAFSLCRIEPENNVHLTLEAFKLAGKPLVFIGNWDCNEYGKKLYKKYSKFDNIRLIKPIYDTNILSVFRSYASVYIHGHSVGGTNPSLVEIMFFNVPIISFDVIYNRYTTENKAHYFKDIEELKELIEKPSSFFIQNSLNMNKIAIRRYTWSIISSKYEKCY